jgi:hypothetical protein
MSAGDLAMPPPPSSPQLTAAPWETPTSEESMPEPWEVLMQEMSGAKKHRWVLSASRWMGPALGQAMTPSVRFRIW